MKKSTILIVHIFLAVLIASVVAIDTNNTSFIGSWRSPIVTCPRINEHSTNYNVTTIPSVLGNAYPNQSLIGSPYWVSGDNADPNGIGGISYPNKDPDLAKRNLSPPCNIINNYGRNVTTYIEIDQVWLTNFNQQTDDCFNYTTGINTGYICDWTGDIFNPTTPKACNQYCIHVEIDRDWQNAGYCGINYCNFSELYNKQCFSPCSIQSSCHSTITGAGTCLDMMGFVFYDPVLYAVNGTILSQGHWELHPLTAWRTD